MQSLVKILFLFFAGAVLYSQEYTAEIKYKFYSQYSAVEQRFLEVDSAQLKEKEFYLAFDNHTLDIELGKEFSFSVEFDSKEFNPNQLYPAQLFIEEKNIQDNMLFYDVAVCCFTYNNLEDFENFLNEPQKLQFTFFDQGTKPVFKIVLYLNKIQKL